MNPVQGGAPTDVKGDRLKDAVRRWQQKSTHKAAVAAASVPRPSPEGPTRQVLASIGLAAVVKAAAEATPAAPANFTGPLPFTEIMRRKKEGQSKPAATSRPTSPGEPAGTEVGEVAEAALETPSETPSEVQVSPPRPKRVPIKATPVLPKIATPKYEASALSKVRPSRIAAKTRSSDTPALQKARLAEPAKPILGAKSILGHSAPSVSTGSPSPSDIPVPKPAIEISPAESASASEQPKPITTATTQIPRQRPPMAAPQPKPAPAVETQQSKAPVEIPPSGPAAEIAPSIPPIETALMKGTPVSTVEQPKPVPAVPEARPTELCQPGPGSATEAVQPRSAVEVTRPSMAAGDISRNRVAPPPRPPVRLSQPDITSVQDPRAGRSAVSEQRIEEVATAVMSLNPQNSLAELEQAIRQLVTVIDQY